MTESRQHAYLRAMGIDVWVLRDPVAAAMPVSNAPAGLKLGPGSGGILLVCLSDAESATRLAHDISRSLHGQPVWAWPDDSGSDNGIEAAVQEHLFTTVAIFGDVLARRLFAGDMPASVAGARLLLLPELRDLERQPGRRRALWRSLCLHGMTGGGESPV